MLWHKLSARHKLSEPTVFRFVEDWKIQFTAVFPLFSATDAACNVLKCPNVLSTKNFIFIQFFKPSKFSRDFYLRHQCYQLVDCSATDIKKGQTKKWSSRKNLLSNFGRFCTERAEKGLKILKSCFILLISLNLGMFKKYYMFQFSHWNSQRFFF